MNKEKQGLKRSTLVGFLSVVTIVCSLVLAACSSDVEVVSKNLPSSPAEIPAGFADPALVVNLAEVPGHLPLVDVGKGEFVDKADFDELTGDQQKALNRLGIQDFNKSGQGFDESQEGGCLKEAILPESWWLLSKSSFSSIS